MRISDWSSDVCSSDLKGWDVAKYLLGHEREMISGMGLGGAAGNPLLDGAIATVGLDDNGRLADPLLRAAIAEFEVRTKAFAMTSERFIDRSEENTSELQSLMRNSYAVFCLKTKQTNTIKNH